MGSELQTKYQKLAQEYAKLRAQVDVLKQGVKTEQKTKLVLEEELRTKDQALRKHVQENESLSFRNQQLSKRVAMLQDELDSPSKFKKKKEPHGSFGPPSDIQNEELAAKITENEHLHTKIIEITHKSQKTITQLKEKIATLEQNVVNNDTLVAELNKENLLKCELIEQEKALLQGKVEKLTEDLRQSEMALRLSTTDKEEGSTVIKSEAIFNDTSQIEFNSLNVANVDRQSNSQITVAMAAAKSLLTNFMNHFTSFCSYMRQRCLLYPVDTSTGMQTSPVNEKLTEVIKMVNSTMDNLMVSLQQYYVATDTSWTDGTVMADFEKALGSLCSYFDILTVYIQLSLETESKESVCGLQLSQTNSIIGQLFQKIPAILHSFTDYIKVLSNANTNATIVTTVIDRLRWCTKALHENLIEISNHLNSKITLEYQLPTVPQRLKTLNECMISSCTSLCTTSQEALEYFNQHGSVLCAVFCQVDNNSTKKAVSATLTSALRSKAIAYHVKLASEDSYPIVPYPVAVQQSKEFAEMSENYEALSQQITILQRQLSSVSEEKEQLSVDLQLLALKHEKELKRAKEDSVGGLLTSEPHDSQSETDTSNDESTDTLLRSHFTSRISQLNSQLQKADGKVVFLLSQCNTLTKQLTQCIAAKTSHSHDLESARESIHQLQDQMMTLSTSYESQLSTMSDHLCEIQDKLLKRDEEIEILKKGKKKWSKT